MSLTRIIAVFVMAIMFTTAAAQDEVKVLINDGAKAYTAKDYTAALAKFEEAITKSEAAGEKDLDAVYKAGMASYKLKNYEKAIGFFTSLEGTPKKCGAYKYLNNLYKKTDTDKRTDCLKKAIAECPKLKGKFSKDLAKAYLISGSKSYNAGAKIQAGVASLKTTDAKYIAEMEKANAKFKSALKDLEASYEVKAKNKKLLKMLSTVYTNLEMKDKAAKVDAELAALGK